MSRERLMTHLVAYYPDKERTLDVARGMIDGGAAYLEIQFPFSDPSADGPMIQQACSHALEAGFTLEGGFDIISRIRAYSDIPIFLMSYGNVPFTYGLEQFILRCRDVGIAGLIVPDMILGADEGLYDLGRAHGLPIVPVLVPTIPRKRLDEFLNLRPEYLYVAIRTGITGKETKIDASVISFLEDILPSGIKTLTGFGVKKREQVEVLAPYAHGIIVGSALVREINAHIDASADALYNAVKMRVADLVG